MPVPEPLLRRFIRRRQCRTYVTGDGVTRETRPHVEGIYLSALDRLERGLRAQPLRARGAPGLADFGFFASMFRHFSLDPTGPHHARPRARGVRVGRAAVERPREPGSGDFSPAGAIPSVWREFVHRCR